MVGHAMDERMFGLEWWPALSSAHSCERGNPVSCFFWSPLARGRAETSRRMSFIIHEGISFFEGCGFPHYIAKERSADRRSGSCEAPFILR